MLIYLARGGTREIYIHCKTSTVSSVEDLGSEIANFYRQHCEGSCKEEWRGLIKVHFFIQLLHLLPWDLDPLCYALERMEQDHTT